MKLGRILAGLGITLVGAVTPAAAPGPLFLLEDSRLPTVSISWPTASGGVISMTNVLPWTSAGDRKAIGHNLEAFATVGGTRLDKGAANPAGAIFRTGFYRTDLTKPFFEDLAQNASITIVMSNVRFNRDAVPRPESVLQHLRYTPEDSAACGLGDTGLDQYNTGSRSDSMAGKVITVANGRLGSLSGSDPRGGSVTFDKAPDGSITMTAVIPYALFRHVRDPWKRTNPGTFFEPTHFHVEVEVLPKDVSDQLDAARAAEGGAVSNRR